MDLDLPREAVLVAGNVEACLVLVAMDDWLDLVDDMTRGEVAEDLAWIDERPLRYLALGEEEEVLRGRRSVTFCGCHMKVPR